MAPRFKATGNVIRGVPRPKYEPPKTDDIYADHLDWKKAHEEGKIGWGPHSDRPTSELRLKEYTNTDTQLPDRTRRRF